MHNIRVVSMQTDQEWRKDVLYLLISSRCRNATALSGLLLESFWIDNSYLVHCVTEVFRIHSIQNLWSLYYAVYYTVKPPYSKSESYFWQEKFKRIRGKKGANDGSESVCTMTLCLKDIPRKGKLGFSPDGLKLFYLFSFIYVCVYIHKCMYAHTPLSFWE